MPDADQPRDMDWEQEYRKTYRAWEEVVAQREGFKKQSEDLLGKSTALEHTVAQHDLLFGTLDERLREQARAFKKTRDDEVLLLKPYIRPKSALKDLENGITLLSVMNAHDREYDWVRHYFFEPLNRLNVQKGFAPAGHLMYKRMYDELREPQPAFSLAHIEALLYRMMRLPQEYAPAFAMLRAKPLALREIGPKLYQDAANRMYAEEIRTGLKKFVSLSDGERIALRLRWLYAGDDAKKFDAVLQTAELPHADSLSEMHNHIKQLEASAPGYWPVNLRWFDRLPKDISEFLRRQPSGA